MKRFFILPLVLLCCIGCENNDTKTNAQTQVVNMAHDKNKNVQNNLRIQGAKIAYDNCINTGTYKRWCKCLEADLLDTMTEEQAREIITGGTSPQLQMQLLGARMRCECRENPSRVASYGLPCDGIKKLNY